MSLLLHVAIMSVCFPRDFLRNRSYSFSSHIFFIFFSRIYALCVLREPSLYLSRVKWFRRNSFRDSSWSSLSFNMNSIARLLRIITKAVYLWVYLVNQWYILISWLKTDLTQTKLTEILVHYNCQLILIYKDVYDSLWGFYERIYIFCVMSQKSGIQKKPSC